MEAVEAVIFGIFGLIVGSFLNVLILREGEGRSVAGRSSCRECGTKLEWLDLVPVVSWIVLQGRCRHCGSSISLQYPLVEALTAVLFALIGYSSLPIVQKILGVLIVSLFVAITVYDIYHTLIPDMWSYTASILSFFYGLFAAAGSDLSYVVFAGPIAALPLFSLWFVSKGRWMGLGDAKLALSIGWLLGPFLGLAAILGAFMLGALVSVCILLPLPRIIHIWRSVMGFTRTPNLALLRSFFRSSNDAHMTRQGQSESQSTALQQRTMPKLVCGFTMQSEVPFGPFLIWSTLVVWLVTVYGYEPFAHLF